MNWLERWRGKSLSLRFQIVALLLVGLIVAQAITLGLTVLLPPKPAPKYRMMEVALALKGGSLKGDNPRPLKRLERADPPSLESPNWVVSERSRADLARMLDAPITDVRILFYSPPALTGVGTPLTLSSLEQPTQAEPAALVGAQPDAPLLIRASFRDSGEFQAAPGGPPGAGPAGPGYPGGGFPGGLPNLPLPRPASGPPQISTPPAPQPLRASSPAAIPKPLSDKVAAQTQAQQAPPSTSATPPATSPINLPAPPAPSPVLGSIPGGPANPITGPAPQVFAESPVTSSRADPIEPATPRVVTNEASITAQDVQPVTDEALDGVLAAPGSADTGASPSRFVIGSADVGGYLLPSDNAPAKGLLGLVSTPFVQGDFVAAYKVGPGRWVTVQPAPETFPNTFQKRLALWFLLSALLVVPVGLLFARRLAQPLVEFAEAAERLGRDPSGQQAPLRGPAEIGRAAAAFNLMQGRLKRYIDDRTAMVGAISHDLRTPLARMRFRLERVAPEIREGMSHDITQMDEMISAVLAFIRDASEPSVRERVELRSILECVVDNAAIMGGDVTLDPGGRVPVDADSLSVERVLTNLIDNALKYGDRAVVRVYEDGSDVIAEVQDHGPGLPDEELEKVFLPFYRSDHSRNLNKTGIGLGLAVSRSIARAHGGDISLSRGEHGLKAQLRLPRAPLAA